MKCPNLACGKGLDDTELPCPPFGSQTCTPSPVTRF